MAIAAMNNDDGIVWDNYSSNIVLADAALAHNSRYGINLWYSRTTN